MRTVILNGQSVMDPSILNGQSVMDPSTLVRGYAAPVISSVYVTMQGEPILVLQQNPNAVMGWLSHLDEIISRAAQ